MKKIMFNDKYGLTDAVLNGAKTMTRRIISGGCEGIEGFYLLHSAYKVGEVVAVAQNYQDAINEFNRCGDKAGWAKLIANAENGCAGYRNKMFVRADLMPHRIRITDIKVERLQDISDEDIMQEGIFEDLDEHGGLYTTPFYDFYGNLEDGFYEPREAFAALIDKVIGKGTWDSNPVVYVYAFELIDS